MGLGRRVARLGVALCLALETAAAVACMSRRGGRPGDCRVLEAVAFAVAHRARVRVRSLAAPAPCLWLCGAALPAPRLVSAGWGRSLTTPLSALLAMVVVNDLMWGVGGAGRVVVVGVGGGGSGCGWWSRGRWDWERLGTSGWWLSSG